MGHCCTVKHQQRSRSRPNVKMFFVHMAASSQAIVVFVGEKDSQFPAVPIAPVLWREIQQQRYRSADWLSRHPSTGVDMALIVSPGVVPEQLHLSVWKEAAPASGHLGAQLIQLPQDVK